MIDEYGNRSTTVYDGYGNVEEQIDALGNITTFLYDTQGRQNVTIDPLGNRTTTVFDSHGNVSETIDQLGDITTTVYDSSGSVEETIDPLGNITTFLYDAYGRQNATIDPLGNRATTVFDSYGREQATIDPLGNRTTTVYDSYGNVAASIDPLGNRTTTVYDSHGREEATIDALGNRTTTVYDSHGQVSEQINALGNITTTVYDSMGRESATIDPLGNRTTFHYDSFGRQDAVTDPLGNTTTTVYDTHDRAVATIDPLGGRTTTVYDSYNRQVATIDPDGNITTMVLNSLGQEINLIDASSNVTTFAYDALGRQTSELMANAGGHPATMAYDADGHLLSSTDPDGRRIDYTYDADGRQIGEAWYNSGGTRVNLQTFTYDAVGNQLTAADQNGTYTMTYDAKGEVISEKDIFGDTMTFTYDAVGNRVKVQDSLNGVTSSVYDAAGELTSREVGGTGVTPLRVDQTFDAAGNNTQTVRYSDLAGTTKIATTNTAYDADHQVLSIINKNAGGTTISAITNTYDANHDLITQKADSVTTTYTYDPAGQVTSDGTTTVTYGPTGNRVTVVNATATATYSTGAGNQLMSDGTWTYTYDYSGNLLGKTNIASGDYWVYLYDNKDEMTQALEYNSAAALLQKEVFKYDVFGNRTENMVYTGATLTSDQRYAMDGWNPAKAGTTGNSRFDIWAVLDGTASNALLQRNIEGDGIDQHYGWIDASGNLKLYLTDAQGSTRQVIDSSGSVLDSYTYDAFGNATESHPGSGGMYSYTGRQFDAETGLQYNRARYYDPSTARWISQDPMGFNAGDCNLYRYVTNAAMDEIDPSGLMYISVNLLTEKATLCVAVRFIFQRTGWTDQRQNTVKKTFVKQVQTTFNNNNFRLVTGPNPRGERARPLTTGGDLLVAMVSRYYSCTCPQRRLQPQILLDVVDSGADFNIYVSPGAVPAGQSQNVELGIFVGWHANLFELASEGFAQAQVGPHAGQVFFHQSWAHEFGHLLGLDHPGGNSNDDGHYDADSPALMGRGSELRREYFQPWANLLSNT